MPQRAKPVHALQREKPQQHNKEWPGSPQLETRPHSTEDPAQPKISKLYIYGLPWWLSW